jgi:multidrug efflux system outer membrane protein
MARQRRVGAAAGVLVLLLVHGCALTPDYERPELDVPDRWVEPADAGASIANLPWWELYGDPELHRLVEVALEGNKDLALALARVTEASELVTFTRADQFPFLNVFGGRGRGRPSPALVPFATTQDRYQLAAGLSFEIDLWKKLSRATEASRADLLATEAAYRNVTISLVANVASFYFLLRDLDYRLEISQRTVVSRGESLEIVGARFEKGVVPELDVNQAQIELAIAEAAVAAFERQVVQVGNALRVLLGRNPGPIERGLTLDEQVMDPEVPVGLPSELLQRRPDLVAAEQQLAAETARIGVAEALRYPSFTLTGTLGAISTEASNLLTNQAKSWDVFAGFFAPIFNSGKLKSQAESQRARTEQALQGYQAVVLQALREVEDTLIAVRTLRVEHAARLRQVVASRNAARLSRARYDGGVVDYLEVLDTERTLFRSELDESATRQRSLTAVVRLYKALGGGWTQSP